jgi:hypothetical protein
MSDKPAIRKVEEFEVPPLTHEQIEMAQMMIDDLHPIKKTHIDQAFNYICFPIVLMRGCCSKSKEEKLANEREQFALLEQKDTSHMSAEEKKLFNLRKKNMQKQIRAKADLVGGDPFLSLGFGMSAYINTLSTLVFTFIVISCITHPILLSY